MRTVFEILELATNPTFVKYDEDLLEGWMPNRGKSLLKAFFKANLKGVVSNFDLKRLTTQPTPGALIPVRRIRPLE